MFRLLCLVCFLSVLPSVAQADPAQTADPASQPDLVSFGLAYADFDKTEGRRQTADFRVEYRWGLSLLPLVSDYFKNWDPYVQFHPFAGGEMTGLGELYGLSGLAMDWYINRHIVFTWSEGLGLFTSGDAYRMGSILEFRSQGELGWRFDNDMRLTVEASHISNDKITLRNPGMELAGLYLHVPVDTFFGH
jgi:hypothetical protein